MAKKMSQPKITGITQTHRADGVKLASPIFHPDPALDPMLPFCLARKEIGVQEIPGEAAEPKIVAYDAYTSMKATSDEVPWCSAFMCAMAERAGFSSTRSAAALSWKDYGVSGDGRKGDIAVFSRPGGHHVAFVNSNYSSGDRFVECLGGNQDDQVCVKNIEAVNLICFRRFP